MMDLSPKIQFQQHRKEEATAWTEIINSPVTKSAITYSFAELGYRGTTPEELVGAKKFIAILSRISSIEEVKELPKKELTSYA